MRDTADDPDEESVRRSADARGAARRAGSSRPRWALRLGLAAAASATFGSLLALHQEGGRPTATTSRPVVPPPEWADDPHAPALFRLRRTNGFAPLSHLVLRRSDGARKDVFATRSEGEGLALRLALSEKPNEAKRSPFFVEMARLSAEAGRGVTFAAQPDALATRLGVLEAADLSMSVGGKTSACLGFRTPLLGAAGSRAPLFVVGFACDDAADAAPGDVRRSVACLIDSLEMSSEAKSEGVELSAEMEPRRPLACDGGEHLPMAALD